MSCPIALSPAIAATVRCLASHDCLFASATAATAPNALKSRIKRASRGSNSITRIRSDVVVKSADSMNAVADPSSSTSSEEEIEAEAKAKVGSRVRVTAPLKVYHVNRVPEVNLEGMEGKLKDFVAVWRGKRISANLPYKVEFFKEIEGRGPVKFVAHLKEDEFEFIDP